MDMAIIANGQPAALIVVGNEATEKERLAVQELQAYVERLAGARLRVVAPDQALAGQESLLLVGRPQTNELVQEVVGGDYDVEGLKPDGFVLCTGQVEGRSAVAVTAADEMGVLYAAYALLEELGATFLLSGDVLPEPVADLAVPEMGQVYEPSLSRRGLLIALQNPHSGIQSLSDYRALVDQMVKLRLNYLSFWVASAEPWVEFSFRGEQNLIGDINDPESGYLWPRGAMTTDAGARTSQVEIGVEHFEGRPYMAPMELQGVRSAGEAHRRFSGMMRELFRYAQASGVKVGLHMNPVRGMPYNHARFVRKVGQAPASRAIFGAVVDPTDPGVLEWAQRWQKAILETYPDIDDLFVINMEGYSSHPDSPELYERLWPYFEGAKQVFEEKWMGSQYVGGRTAEELIEFDMAQFELTRQLVEAAKQLRPDLPVGMGFLFRGYLLPAVDKLLDREIPIMDWQSSGVIPVEEDVNAMHFADMGERERYIVPDVDDDGSMFGVPFYLRKYQRDGLFGKVEEAGVSGFMACMFRVRGTEHHTRFLAQAAWEPELTPEAFYERYAREIFGPQAAGHMQAAFEALEDNEEFLGWRGQKNFQFWRGDRFLQTRLLAQDNPFDGPPDAEAMAKEAKTATIIERAVEYLDRALVEMEKAEGVVSAKGEPLLGYLINKTDAYKMHLEMVVDLCKGSASYAEAFMEHGDDEAALVAALAGAERHFVAAQEKAREAARRFAELVDHPCDLAILFLANVYTIKPLDQGVDLIRRVVNYHHGRPYWDVVGPPRSGHFHEPSYI